MEHFLQRLDDIEMDLGFKNRIGSLLHKTDVENLHETITKEMFNRIYLNYNEKYCTHYEKCAFVLVLLYETHKTTTLNDGEYDVALRKLNSDVEPMFAFYHKNGYDHSEIIHQMSYQKHALHENNTWKKSDAVPMIQDILRFICGYYHYYDTTREISLGKDLLLACIMFYQRLIGFGEPNVQISFERWSNLNT